MLRRSPLSLIVLAALVVACSWFSSGCGSHKEKAVEQTNEQTQPVDPDGTLSIRNALGSVRILGSSGSEMKLKTIKRAWSDQQLNGIAVAVSVKPGSVSMETSFPPQKTFGFSARAGQVDYELTIPRTVKIARLEIGNGDVFIEGMRRDIRANLVNGALTSLNCSGNAQLSVANGRLDLSYDKWEEQQQCSVEASIISGNARLFVPRKGSFHLVAEARNGNVDDHFSEQREQNARRATKVDLLVGGQSASELVIRTTNGNIEIAPSKTE